MVQEGASQRQKGRSGPNTSQQQQPTKAAPEGLQTSPEQESRLLLLNEKLKQQEEQIKAFKSLEGTLLKENSSLREECRISKRELLQVSSTLQKSVDACAAEAAAAKEELEACKLQIVQAKAQFAQQEAAFHAVANHDKCQLTSRIASLEESLAGLEEFKRHREGLEKAKNASEQLNVELTRDYEEKLGEMHLRCHRLQQRVEQLEQEAAEQAAAAGASNESEAEPLRLLHQNRKLAASLRKEGEEKAALERKVKDLEAEIGRLKMERQLAGELEKKATETSAVHGKKAEAALETIAALEAELAATVAAKEEALATHKGLNAQIESSKTEIASLKRQIHRYAQEVCHAQENLRDVLAERSEAQAFLVSSLRAVRREASAARDAEPAEKTTASRHRRKTAAAAAVAASPSTFYSSIDTSVPSPALSTTSSTASGSVRSSALAAAASVNGRLSSSSGRLIDIADLTWEEREAVLRLLLAQINGKPSALAAQAAFTPVDSNLATPISDGASGLGSQPPSALPIAAINIKNIAEPEELNVLPNIGSPTCF